MYFAIIIHNHALIQNSLYINHFSIVRAQRGQSGMGRVSWAGCHGPCLAKNVGVGRRMASVQCSAEILVDAPRILGQAWDTCGQTGPEERSPGHPV